MNNVFVINHLLASFTRRIYWVQTGAVVNIDYFLNARTTNFYINKKWAACYAINTKEQQNLRYKELLSSHPNLFESWCQEKGFTEAEIVEIACIAFNKKLSFFNRTQVYWNVIKDALASNKKIVIGGTVHLSILKKFKLLLPNELGTIKVTIEGHSNPETLYLVYAESKGLLWKFLITLPKAIGLELVKIVKGMV